jgi:anti-anti-sigma factor
MNEPLKPTYTICGAVALIAFDGELELTTAERAGAQLLALLEAGAREILVDLSGITFLDSAGVRTLMEVAKTARERGGRLYVFRAQGQARRVIEHTRVDYDGP